MATLKQNIVANRDGDDQDSKMFNAGMSLDIEDWDDDWFAFADPNSGDYYECEERPDQALVFDNVKQNSAPTENVPYRPVPNMTPLSRRHLLL